jgi:hypothetical protein
MIPNKLIFVPILLVLCVTLRSSAMADKINYEEIISNVAVRIENLKKDFPQLKDFSAIRNTNLEDLSISYDLSYSSGAASRRMDVRRSQSG